MVDLGHLGNTTNENVRLVARDELFTAVGRGCRRAVIIAATSFIQIVDHGAAW